MCKMKDDSFFLKLRKRKLHVEILPALHDFCGNLKLSCQGKSPSKGRYKIKTFSNTFGYSVILDLRKTLEEKKTMGSTELLFFCRGRSLKKSWRTAKGDTAIDWEVIIDANRCVYRENVLDEKCFFFIKVKGAKVACKNFTWLVWLSWTF